MKSSGGSRRGPADVAPGANHGGENVGGHDDAELRAMRTVWLEMRDEEPPGGGLAELLAAARVKAAAMQPRPSRWQRLAAALRRPPVLALATAMVLLAGAAILGRRAIGPLSRADEGATHHGLEVAAGSAVQAQLTPRATAGPSPGGTVSESDAAAARTAVLQAEDALRENDAATARTGAAANEAAMLRTAQANEAMLRAAQASEAALRTAQANEAALRAAHTGPRSTGSQDESAVVRAAAHTDATTQRTAQGGDAAGVGAGASEPSVGFTRPPAAAPPRHEAPRGARLSAMEPPAPAVAARPDRDGAAAGGSARSSGHGSAPANAERAGEIGTRLGSAAPGDVDDGEPSPRAREAAPSSTSGAGSSAASPARRPGPSSTELARLHQQCESAARRGDCPVVRQLVERITRTDRGYRGRVAKDSAVAKCLAD